MAVTPKVFVERKQVEDSQTTQYTATLAKALIDKCTVTNTTGSTATISVHLVASGGSPTSSNLVLSAKSIAPGETYTCPEVVGQMLESGGFISTLASTASALTISVSGREVT
jgi:hypothetical protein